MGQSCSGCAHCGSRHAAPAAPQKPIDTIPPAQSVYSQAQKCLRLPGWQQQQKLDINEESGAQYPSALFPSACKVARRHSHHSCANAAHLQGSSPAPEGAEPTHHRPVSQEGRAAPSAEALHLQESQAVPQLPVSLGHVQGRGAAGWKSQPQDGPHTSSWVAAVLCTGPVRTLCSAGPCGCDSGQPQLAAGRRESETGPDQGCSRVTCGMLCSSPPAPSPSLSPPPGHPASHLSQLCPSGSHCTFDGAGGDDALSGAPVATRHNAGFVEVGPRYHHLLQVLGEQSRELRHRDSHPPPGNDVSSQPSPRPAPGHHPQAGCLHPRCC